MLLCDIYNFGMHVTCIQNFNMHVNKKYMSTFSLGECMSSCITNHNMHVKEKSNVNIRPLFLMSPGPQFGCYLERLWRYETSMASPRAERCVEHSRCMDFLIKLALFRVTQPFCTNDRFPAYLQISPYLQIYKSVSPHLQICIVTEIYILVSLGLGLSCD